MNGMVQTDFIQIGGAGPAGLAAAITLARAGRRVLVHEAQAEVGYRFDGDFTGAGELEHRAGCARPVAGNRHYHGVRHVAMQPRICFRCLGRALRCGWQQGTFLHGGTRAGPEDVGYRPAGAGAWAGGRGALQQPARSSGGHRDSCRRSLNEFVAMGQFLAWSRKQGMPFWRTFWTGDAMDGGSDDTSKGLVGTPREQWVQATRGVTYPWTLTLSIAIGVWLTFTRLTFDSSGAMADSDHLIGALVVTFSIMAWAEVGRAIRFINIPFGAWLIAAPWLLDGIASPLAAWNGVLCGVLLIALAIPRGLVKDSYAGWDRYIV